MANLHLVGNAHIDPVWLWRWQEGFAEITATFRSALDRMKDFPDFHFTSACAAYYQWVETVDPQMFDEIRQRVKEGRWHIVGGWLIQPDCNTPDGESFARHSLLGQRHFQEKFGVTVKTGYNVDSFGHNASLPKILRQSGMENYVFMRPGAHEKELPQNIFTWESKDGSAVTAFRIHNTYCMIERNIHNMDQVQALADKDGRDHMLFYGVGNHGGGPTIDLIKAIKEKNFPGMRFSDPDTYFDCLDKRGLPVVADELQHHARGCYSASSFVKASNRRSENALLMAERMSLLAKKLTGADYPGQKLNEAWKGVLFNQFHDVMGGCSVKQAYADAGYLYGQAMNTAEQAIFLAAHRICRSIDTLHGEQLPSVKPGDCMPWIHERLGTPVVVFNPHCHRVKMPVRVNFVPSRVTDAEGREIPVQEVHAGYYRGPQKSQGLFMADVGPMGYAVYSAEKKEGLPVFANEMHVTEQVLENSCVRVEFDQESGEICRYRIKQTGEELIGRACKAVLLDDSGNDTWAHDRVSMGPVVGEFGKAQFRVIEEGPVRACLRVETRWGDSRLEREYALCAGSPVLTVTVRAQMQEKHRVLKLAFPTDAKEVVAKIPYGTICRPVGTGEEPCGSWIAANGLCVANDSKHGYDAEDGFLRLTAARTAVYADHADGKGVSYRDHMSRYMDMEPMEFRYAVYPYGSAAEAERNAEELNFELPAYMETFHDGTLPLSYTGFACDRENVTVCALKEHEDSENCVLRVCEMNGEDTAVQFRLFGNTIRADIGHDAVMTLLEDGSRLNMMEWPME